MSALTAYLALAIFPFIINLFPNPVWLRWELKRGFKEDGAPVPPEIADKIERAGRYMLFFIDAVVAFLVFMMMRRYSVSSIRLGLHLEHWKLHLLVGCAAGISWIGLHILLLYLLEGPRLGSATRSTQQGSAALWVSIFFVGAFAEEFWRAFCLFAFTNTGHSIFVSVVLTAIAFSAGHLRSSIGGYLGVATLGVGLALLYLWQGSIVATYSAHVVANLGWLYWNRRVK